MAKPKLALIPAAQGSKFYSVLPSNGVGDFNFTRSGSATRINKDGLIETVLSGVSRLNYPLIDGVVNGCPSHLLEPQRTNLITYSEDFSNSAWGKIGSTEIISNNSISPGGSLNSDKVNASTTYNGLLALQDGFSVSIGSDYSVSFFAKKGNLRYLQLFHGGGQVVGNSRTNFDLENGVVTVSDSGHAASVEDYGNGWFRCIVVLETLSTTLQLYFSAVKDANATRSAASDFNENDNILIWGAQLEQGSYPTSYIPTSGSTVTRSAETANGSGDAATFNSLEGVLMYQIKPINLDSTHKRITLSDGTSTNRIIMGFDNNNNVNATVYDGSNQAILGGNYTGKDELSKYALKYKENDFALWLNGFKVATDTSGVTFPSGTLNQFRFEDGNGGLDFYGSAKQIQYFDSALNDSDLETLTSWTSFTDLANGQLYSIK